MRNRNLAHICFALLVSMAQIILTTFPFFYYFNADDAESKPLLLF